MYFCLMVRIFRLMLVLLDLDIYIYIYKSNNNTNIPPIMIINRIYRGADKSLAQPTSRCILFDGENISFMLVLLYIYI
jgi:hypothetical protein